MNVVATFTGLFALIQLLRRKPAAEVFLSVYLFALFAMPGWCRFTVPMVPKMTFHETAILPIAVVFFLRHRKLWSWSLGDMLVIGFVVLVTVSEYTNAGYKEAQNLGFGYLSSAALPYMLAKGLVEPLGLRVKFLRRIVVLLAFVTLAFAYEARMWVNPYRYFTDVFFPGTAWITTARYGLARAAGPFAHCIFAGAVFLIGLRLQIWLQNSNSWEKYFPKFHPFGLTKARIYTGILFIGLALTLARGPQIGAVLATIIAVVGAGRNPARRALILLVAVVAIGIPVAIQSYQYAAVGREKAKTVSQESAAYRKELMDKYVDIAEHHALLGWGRTQWPKVSGMPSIDNHYLLLALMHGLGAPIIFLGLLIATTVRLLRNGFAHAPLKPSGSSLSFTLAGIVIGSTFTYFTVYLGENALPILFLILGYAEGYLLAGGDATLKRKPQAGSQLAASAPAKPRFAVVMA